MFSPLFRTGAAVRLLRASLYPGCTLLQVNCPLDAHKETNYSTYMGSKLHNPNEKIEYEVSRDPEEWKFVTRLIPQQFIPEPNKKEEYPSGWKPPDSAALDLPYFVRRTKNHMVPVYLLISFRGMRKITKIRFIKGDIWSLEQDLREYLMKKKVPKYGVRIDEVAGQLSLRGDHVFHVKEWLLSKGF